MRRSSKVVLFVTLLTPSVFAKTLYVGTCHTPSYSTISAAVAAAGVTIRARSPLGVAAGCMGKLEIEF